MLEIITGENIEKLRELAHKDSVNECVEWLIEHYHMVGKEVVKLRDENKKLIELEDRKREFIDIKRREVAGLKIENKELKKELKGVQLAADRTADENEELKARIAELEESEKQSIETMKIMGINCIGDLVKQNEELKEQLRTILAMDKEDPCEQVERLLDDVQRLTTEKTELEDELSELKSSKSEYKNVIKNFMNSAVQNDYKIESLKMEAAELDGALHQANKTIDKLLELLK